MIGTPTLFILGAGASAPFGYPTSIDLRENILSRRNADAIVNALNPAPSFRDPEPFKKTLNEFLDEFASSSVYSIDAFLEFRTKFMDIGKMNIAAYLINHEEDMRLRLPIGNWYMYLYDRLKCSFDDFDKNNISYITFNYDRSLEQFLFEAIRSRFGKSYSECAEKMKNIPIVHLYGQLDPLPWQGKDGKEYSHKKDFTERLRTATKNIKLISNERDITKSDTFQKAYEHISKAERIFFLGFSFDETNLERLNVSLMKNKKIYTSVMGLAPVKQDWVNRYFVRKADTHIWLNAKDALSMLQDDLAIE
jgi:hypothetical protein